MLSTTAPEALRILQTVRPDKASPVPVYLQIAQKLASILKRGTLPAGALLPPERVLCELYGVSRMTLRQAMGLLEREGLIETHRGRGTFVAPQRLQKQQQEFRSFTEEIRLRGGIPQTRMLSFELAEPTQSAAEFFGLPEPDQVYFIKRLRLDNTTPIALETVEIPARIVPLLQRFDLETNSLYRILEESYGLRLDASVEEISAELPSREVRKLLEIPKKTAVLVIHRKTYTDAGQALELSRSTYRADLYSAIVHSVRRTSS